MKYFLPNFITSLNILSGSLAILISFQGAEYLYVSGLLIFLASVFDFFDGFTARLLGAGSEFGKQLDSLSDVISFGLAPSFVMFHLLSNSLGVQGFLSASFAHKLLLLLPFLIVIFSALRLAKFNIDPNQTTSFSGLPTPALAIFVASIPLIISPITNYLLVSEIFNIDVVFFQKIVSDKLVIIFSTIILSALLVLPVAMFSFKFKGFSYSKNKLIYNFLIFSLILIILLQITAVLLIILTYILVSFVLNLSNFKNNAHN